MRKILFMSLIFSTLSCGVREGKEPKDGFTLEGKWRSQGVECERYLEFQKDRVFVEQIVCEDGKQQNSTGLYSYEGNVISFDVIKSSCKALHDVRLTATIQLPDSRLILTDLVSTYVFQKFEGSMPGRQSTSGCVVNTNVTVNRPTTNTNTNTNNNNCQPRALNFAEESEALYCFPPSQEPPKYPPPTEPNPPKTPKPPVEQKCPPCPPEKPCPPCKPCPEPLPCPEPPPCPEPTPTPPVPPIPPKCEDVCKQYCNQTNTTVNTTINSNGGAVNNNTNVNVTINGCGCRC